MSLSHLGNPRRPLIPSHAHHTFTYHPRCSEEVEQAALFPETSAPKLTWLGRSSRTLQKDCVVWPFITDTGISVLTAIQVQGDLGQLTFLSLGLLLCKKGHN